MKKTTATAKKKGFVLTSNKYKDEHGEYAFIEPTDKKKYFYKKSIFVIKSFLGKSTFEDKKVKCIHCDKKFNLSEYKAVICLNHINSEIIGSEFIVCKHSPKCDGSLIDFF